MKKDKVKQLQEQDLKLFNVILKNMKDKDKANVKLTMFDNSRLLFSKYNGFEPLKCGYFRGHKTKNIECPFITNEQINRTLDKFKKNMMIAESMR